MHLGLSLAKEDTTYANNVEEERYELFRLIVMKYSDYIKRGRKAYCEINEISSFWNMVQVTNVSIPPQCNVGAWHQWLTLSFVLGCWATQVFVPAASFILFPAHAGPETGCRVCQLLLTEQGMFYREGLCSPATLEVRNTARGVILLLHERLESGLA